MSERPFCVKGGEIIGNVPTIEELAVYIKDYILNDAYSSEWGTDTVKGATRQAVYNIIQSVVGQLEYKGLWDASVGTYPSNPELGWYYVVSVGGTVNGVLYEIGDWIIWNGADWDKLMGRITDYILNDDYGSGWSTDDIKGATRQSIYNKLETIYSETEVNALLGIGIVNKKWKNCILEGGNPFSDINIIDGEFTGIGNGFAKFSFGVPLNCIIGGTHNLVITQLKISLIDADATNYIFDMFINSWVGFASKVTQRNESTDYKIPQLITWDFVDLTVGGVFERIAVSVNCLSAEFNALKIGYVKVEYYYT